MLFSRIKYPQVEVLFKIFLTINLKVLIEPVPLEESFEVAQVWPLLAQGTILHEFIRAQTIVHLAWDSYFPALFARLRAMQDYAETFTRKRF